MEKVAHDFPEVKCQGCRKKVVRAVTQEGSTATVELVGFKKGNVGLTLSLFGGDPLIVLRQGPTRWKVHQCDTRAHSAASFARKVRA